MINSCCMTQQQLFKSYHIVYRMRFHVWFKLKRTFKNVAFNFLDFSTHQSFGSMQLRSLTPKTRIQFSSHTFFKFLFPKKFWRRPGTPDTDTALARLLQMSTSNIGRGQSQTVSAQK